MTARQIKSLINEINIRLTNLPADLVWIGDQLTVIYGQELPKKDWKKRGIKMSYTTATEIRKLAHIPLMRDPYYQSHFPNKRDDIIALSRLAVKNPACFIESRLNGTMHNNMKREDIRDLIEFGHTKEQLRTIRLRECAANPDLQSGHNIHTGDYSMLSEILADNSVPLFFTDPPWQHDSLQLYGGLARLAAQKLQPGGLCLVYCGLDNLDVIFRLMGEHLKYYSMFVIHYEGGLTKFRKHNNIKSGMQPILVYQKPTAKSKMKKLREVVTDIIMGTFDKGFHEWGHGVEEVKYYIRKLTGLGDLVVDPFLGGGPIAVACKQLGRQCIGTEIDPAVASAVRARLAERQDEEDETPTAKTEDLMERYYEAGGSSNQE
jgi:hypothetical protein